jgi:hypothetical protein
MNNDWISVNERPLIAYEMLGDRRIWVCTDDGMQEFMAAVPYRDKNDPDNTLWWIRHCVIEDEKGLCVVGDDDNEPAGWTIDDIDYWMPLPEPPQSEHQSQ